MGMQNKQAKTPWEAGDRYRTAVQRRNEIARQLEWAEQEINDSEEDVVLLMKANGYPRKTHVGNDIIECIPAESGQFVLRMIFEEDIPSVHGLKNPFVQPAEAEVAKF